MNRRLSILTPRQVATLLIGALFLTIAAAREPGKKTSRYYAALLKHPDSDTHVMSRLLRLEGHSDSTSGKEKRWPVVKSLLSDQCLQEAYRDQDTSPVILHLMQHHCLSPDQVEKFDRQIADTWSQHGLASLEIAQY